MNNSSSLRLFTQKFYRAKGRFLQQNLAYDHIYLLKTKSRKVIPNVATQIILIRIENAHLLINTMKSRHQFAHLLNFNNMIT